MKIAAVVLILISLAVPVTASDDAGRPATNSSVSAELERIFQADQADRTPRDGKPIDWSIVGPRDSERHDRVLEIYRTGGLKLGKDLFHVAMILQHGHTPEDFLLCHELCITAVFLHSESSDDWVSAAKWLAAASEDRFLQSIDRKQRFGTQYRTVDPDPTWHLGEIEEGVTDEMRKAWNVPSIAEAKRREAEMNRK